MQEPSSAQKAERNGGQPMEVLISMSSTVADSKGIDISENHLSLVVDEGIKVIRVIDNETGEVIRQISADEILSPGKKNIERRD